MDKLLGDLRFGVRLLLKTPVFTVVAVLTVALGIGASTTIFGVVNAVWLQPLRFGDDERLVMVWETAPRQEQATSETSLATLADWRAQSKGAFTDLAGFTPEGLTLTTADRPERLRGQRVSASFFEVLDARPALGRGFHPGEEGVGAARVVVLSHRVWKARFAAEAGMLGRSVSLDGVPHEVVGVMGPAFDFPPGAEAWVPLTPAPGSLEERGNRSLRVVGRLGPGVSMEQAAATLRVVAERLAAEHPTLYAGRSTRLTSVREAYLGPARPVMGALIGAVAFVLLISCANMANLLLARAAARRREMATRAALGATRGRLLWQLLTESVLLATLGGVLGVVFASWGTDVISKLMPASLTQRIPGWNELRLDERALLFSLLLSVGTGLLFGLAPALQASRPELTEAIKDGGKGAGSSRGRLRSTLVVAEIALALLLFAGAGLMMRSFYRLQGTSPGFTTDGVLAAEVSLPEGRYPDAGARARFYEQLLGRLAALPGSKGAAAISLLPMSRGNQSSELSVEGRAHGPGERLSANRRVVTPGYFHALAIPLLRGRDVATTDTADAPRVALVNAEMARLFWPGEDAVGKRFQMGSTRFEIVGVVANVRTTYRGQFRAAVPEFYLPFAQSPVATMGVVLTAAGEPPSLISAIRGEAAQLDRELPPLEARPLEQLVAETLGPRRHLAYLMGAFAAIALLMAAGGVYGVMSYSVAQRSHELGVRMALGATEGRIFRLVLTQALRLAGLGVGIGALAALGLMRLMRSLLYEISPSDPATLLGTTALLVTVALAASFVPAWRATRIPPMRVLQAE
jgi:putative ABC transport system permease protein